MPCQHVLLSFAGRRLTDPLFVLGPENLAAVWIAFVKQLRKKVTIAVFGEDQFGFGWVGLGFRVPDLEHSGHRIIHAANFHD